MMPDLIRLCLRLFSHNGTHSDFSINYAVVPVSYHLLEDLVYQANQLFALRHKIRGLNTVHVLGTNADYYEQIEGDENWPDLEDADEPVWKVLPPEFELKEAWLTDTRIDLRELVFGIPYGNNAKLENTTVLWSCHSKNCDLEIETFEISIAELCQQFGVAVSTLLSRRN